MFSRNFCNNFDFIFYYIGNRVHLNVIPRGSDSYNYGISNTHQPVLQYVNLRNDIAYRGKEFR